MSELRLSRLLRGAQKNAVEDVAALVPGGVRVEDLEGKVLVSVGEPTGGQHPIRQHPIRVGARVVGIVTGSDEAERVARWIAHLFAREEEKLALAQETLGRYKELTVLYDLGDALSRVLDVREIAHMVVHEAQRFLAAAQATLYLVGDGRSTLEALAVAGAEEAPRVSLDEESLERRVLRSGRAELVEEVPLAEGGVSLGVGSIVCAPLRTGETVAGILRVTSAPGTRWTAGELKLLTSLAGSSAAAISHAVLHREQLHKQALRTRIDRFVSPGFVEDAMAGRAERAWEGLAVLYCDLARTGVGVGEAASTEAMVDALGAATCTALDVLLSHGATVHADSAEALVAVFPHDEGFTASALRAIDAAFALGERLARRRGGPLDRLPGVGIARGEPDRQGRHGDVFRGLGAAATLQAMATGRVLVDPDVAQALGGRRECVALPRPDAPAYEVRT